MVDYLEVVVWKTSQEIITWPKFEPFEESNWRLLMSGGYYKTPIFLPTQVKIKENLSGLLGLVGDAVNATSSTHRQGFLDALAYAFRGVIVDLYETDELGEDSMLPPSLFTLCHMLSERSDDES
ncbi:unnamed protein product [Dibothriocephalus latus]|uniref:Uncharacterized protein n=1 Tax=Dibothriocephalus latus TaxID=60516 RepID=A0A3P7M441_DIBLA|nr:unnamed protein product [Dibothriocephalus latus]